MSIPTCVIVVRIMPKREESSFDPAVLFDKFCIRRQKYMFDNRDVPTVEPLFCDLDADCGATPPQGDQGGCRYAAIIEQDEGENVARIGLARVRLAQASDGDPGSEYGIEPVGEPVILEGNVTKLSEGDEAKGPALKTAFAHLENIISFKPNHPREDGFVSIVEAPSIVQSVALLLSDRTKIMTTQDVFDPSDGQSSDEAQGSDEGQGSDETSVPADAQLSHFAQCDEYRHPLFKEDEVDGSGLKDCRNGFQVDFDRIVHAKSYRRLVDKAQVYSADKGDHYRTRMTHTQVVMQIARSIAAELGANELLTSTIALAHDLGHTPFGHEGERVLKEKLDHLSEEMGFYLGGFKHNFQSVRVLSQLDETHVGFVGSNVTWQVLEGALWHTRVAAKASETDEVETLRCTFGQMDPLYFAHRGYFDKYVFHTAGGDTADGEKACVETSCSHSWTVEGQIVAIADEVAQRSHDIDDAISAGLITVEELWKLLDHFSYKEFGQEIERIIDAVRAAQDDGRMFISPDDVLRSRVASAIIRHLIQDICKESRKSLKEAKLDSGHMVCEKVVKFSEYGHALNAYLETIVMSRVLASSEVTRSDARGARIVDGLFEAYYDNPKLLPASALRRFVAMEKAMGCADVVDLSLASPQIAADEFAAIKGKGRLPVGESLLPPSASKQEGCGAGSSDFDAGCEEPATSNELRREKTERWHQFAKSSVRKMLDMYDNPEELNEAGNSYLVKHVFLIRVIADYIAGMTDTYATAEYHRLLVD